jgi:ABC-type transport system involved in multi-copper enzyme maturation permease subunit
MTLSIAVLCFTLITIVFCISILWKKDFVALELLRVVGIVSIIGLSAILLITGFSNDQLTPIIGLFGAISGYLLGKESKQINA